MRYCFIFPLLFAGRRLANVDEFPRRALSGCAVIWPARRARFPCFPRISSSDLDFHGFRIPGGTSRPRALGVLSSPSQSATKLRDPPRPRHNVAHPRNRGCPGGATKYSFRPDMEKSLILRQNILDFTIFAKKTTKKIQQHVVFWVTKFRQFLRIFSCRPPTPRYNVGSAL